jgi:adenine/guanine phosphoribosyltransferase-like PRPP-binding protein
MNEYRSLVLHSIDDLDQLEGEETAFPAKGYSYFKYGSTKWADRFAGDLLKALDAQYPDTIVSSAYRYMPTAAHAVTTALGAEITLQGGETQLAKVHRSTLTHGDYSTMSAGERAAVMGANLLAIDPAAVDGKDVLVVDDIRVTGSHEDSLRKLFDCLHPSRVTFAYIAAIDQELAHADPQLEDRVNHAAIKKLVDIERLIGYREFRMNARSCKFILALRHRDELPSFLARLSHDLLSQFYMGALGDGYHLMPLYTPSFELLRQEYVLRREQHSTVVVGM